MSTFDHPLFARIQSWETYFHHFISYLLHTAEGRRMRGRFLKETILRTLAYMGVAVPICVALWYFKLMFTEIGGTAFAVAFLIFDIAFGIAMLRQVYLYRHRVKVVYESHFGAEEVSVVETQPEGDDDAAPVKRTKRKAALVGAGGGPIDDDADLGENDKVVMECADCSKQVTPSLKLSRKMTKCGYCGGALARV